MNELYRHHLLQLAITFHGGMQVRVRVRVRVKVRFRARARARARARVRARARAITYHGGMQAIGFNWGCIGLGLPYS